MSNLTTRSEGRQEPFRKQTDRLHAGDTGDLPDPSELQFEGANESPQSSGNGVLRVHAPPKSVPASLKQAALSLQIAGYWVVLDFPAGAIVDDKRGPEDGKRPMRGAWGKTRSNERDIRTAFDRYPIANISIGLGPGRGPKGAWIADIECDGEEAESSWMKLTGGEELGTPSWRSSRGCHRLIKVDDCLSDICRRIAARNTSVVTIDEFPGLEFRIGADGKQIKSTVPPSRTLTKSGELSDAREWIYDLEMPFSLLPEVAYKQLEAIAQAMEQERSERQQAKGRKEKAPFAVPFSGVLTHYVEKAIVDECRSVETTPQGGRNNALNKAAFSLGTMASWPEMDNQAAKDALAQAARQAELDKDTGGEAAIASTIESGWQAGYHNPRERPEPQQPTRKTVTRSVTIPLPSAQQEQTRAEQNGKAEERATIEITTNEHEVVDQAINAIGKAPNLYQRSGLLVTIIDDVKPEPKALIERSPGTPRIVLLPNAQIRRLLSVHATWCRSRVNRKGEASSVESHVPPWAVEMVSTMGSWPNIRPLTGFVETPTFRPDGSLIDTPGYDNETGLLYRPSIDFPAIPSNPSKEDANEAIKALWDLVEDFPFADKAREAWLAALLTALARPAITGPVPLFLIDANVPGSGKTKLVDIIAILATGREMARGSYSIDDAEMQKTLLSVTIACDRFVLFDNVPAGGTIGGPALDRFLTSSTMTGRILGRSEMTGDLPVVAVLYATGNNLGLKGDALRRVVPITLHCEEERPEERDSFTIKGDLLEYAKRNRGSLVAAALTLIRGYLSAGRPDQQLTPMDFTKWCSLIRNAVKWATSIDPCEGRRKLIADDDETIRNRAIVDGWEALCEVTSNKQLTIANALKELESASFDSLSEEREVKISALRDVLSGWARDGKTPSSKVVGNQLAKIRGRNFGGRSLEKTLYAGTNAWYVKRISRI